jgi:hypothetical protein
MPEFGEPVLGGFRQLTELLCQQGQIRHQLG